MRSITLRSPAKLNLILKVIKKRPDGYHDLKTLFERIDLCDAIRFTANKSGRIRISCDHPQVPQGPRNLVYRVAKILKEEHKISAGVDIRITKRIPVAAGLAGGSSNAAAALSGLNQVWKLSLSKNQLLQYGRRVGSDVPFFLHSCSWGIGRSRGDHIEEVPLSVKLWHVLVVPRVPMYSRKVFSALRLRLTKTGDNVNILIHYLRKNNICRVEKLLSNDLEGGILKIRPGLLTVKTRLEACHLKGITFSGSGPAIFGLVESKREAKALEIVLRRYYKQVFAVRTL